jgi:hypothetical protein
VRVRVESRDRIRGVASVNGSRLGYVLVTIYRQYRVTAAVVWRGRGGVVSRRANVLLMCLQWTWASIARWNEGSSHQVLVCTRSRSTMTHDRVSLSQRGRSNLEELHRAECPKQTHYYLSYVCLLKDHHSCCGCTWIPVAIQPFQLQPRSSDRRQCKALPVSVRMRVVSCNRRAVSIL